MNIEARYVNKDSYIDYSDLVRCLYIYIFHLLQRIYEDLDMLFQH